MGISLKELKKNRLTPAERFVLETIDGAEPRTKLNGDVDWYDKDGKWLFLQDLKNGCLWVNCVDIWSVLKDKFGLNYNEIEELLTNLLCDYTDNGKLKINI